EFALLFLLCPFHPVEPVRQREDAGEQVSELFPHRASSLVVAAARGSRLAVWSSRLRSAGRVRSTRGSPPSIYLLVPAPLPLPPQSCRASSCRSSLLPPRRF